MNADPQTELRAAIAKYGDNCNSFLALYRGFEYLKTDQGILAYADTHGAWVGASEPLGESAVRGALLKSFAEAAGAEFKYAVAIPVSERTAKIAEEVGYRSLKIGTEPRFDLTRYDPSVDRVASARQMSNRGAFVEEFRPERISTDVRHELDQITTEWLAGRKTVALSFLNTVDPWALTADKRYFWLKHKGVVMAFVAAIPIWTCDGWYLIDVLRRDRAPVGTTEMLLLESMRLLKKGGARQISLGVAPLSGLGGLVGKGKAYRLLHFVFERGNLLYNFKPLYQFKLKFSPTHSEDAYIIYHPADFSLKMARGLSEAFLPNGIVDATVSGFLRGLIKFKFAHWINAQVSDILVLRPPPRRLWTLLHRIRWTLSIGALIYGLRAMTTPAVLDRFAFTAAGLKALDISSLTLSPFLHWDKGHLAFNTISLFLFCGTVEYLAGSAAMLICFILGAFLGNPLTTVGFKTLGWLFPRVWLAAASEKDVGTSLGIFACAGSFPYLFKKGWRLGALLVAFCFVYSYATGSVLSLNHIFALLIGYVAFGAWVRI